MLGNHDPLFNIPYTLPSNTHSITIASRRPTAGNIQSTKYMPDYGGMLEIPGGNFKQNGLATGYPFSPEPHYLRLMSNEPENQEGPSCLNCVAIASYIESQERRQFTTIRAIRSTLYLDSALVYSDDNGNFERVYDSTTYAHIPYPYNISGIKYDEDLNDLLMVKFSRGLKLLQLNKSYQLPVWNNDDESDGESPVLDVSQSALQFIESFPERKGYKFKDACLHPHSRGMIALASSSDQDLQVRLFDISRSPKVPYNTIQRSLIDDSYEGPTQISRRQTLRSFKPTKSFIESVQQLDCDISHLFNIVLTTTHKVSIIDPRLQGLGQTIIDKNNMNSLFPSELIVKTNLSRRCDNQLYCMSNMNLWVLDRRFPSNPISTTTHMLEPTSHESMHMKLIQLNEGLETLCMSSNGRLAMVTFDRTRAASEADSLVTPRSRHLPVHEPSPAETTGSHANELIGLSVTTKPIFDEGVVFTVAQLSFEGDVCIRGYQANGHQEARRKTQAAIIIEQNRSRHFNSKTPKISRELEERDLESNSGDVETDTEYIDITTTEDITELDRNLRSTRASKKLESMRYKLRRR